MVFRSQNVVALAKVRETMFFISVSKVALVGGGVDFRPSQGYRRNTTYGGRVSKTENFATR